MLKQLEDKVNRLSSIQQLDLLQYMSWVLKKRSNKASPFTKSPAHQLGGVDNDEDDSTITEVVTPKPADDGGSNPDQPPPPKPPHG